MLKPGARIDRYELVRMLGEGSVAQVWLVRQEPSATGPRKHGFEKHFALKAVHPHLARDARFRATFLEEARRAAAIEHPNVAQVFDLGEHEGLLYLVMEHVDGKPLDTLIVMAGGAVPAPVALRIAASVCDGLHAAHARGIVHGHVSPHVVMVSMGGDVKLIDFGTTRAATDASGDLLAVGEMLSQMLAGPPLAAIAPERFATAKEMAAAIEGVLATMGPARDLGGWLETLGSGEPAAKGFMDVRALAAAKAAGATRPASAHDDDDEIGPVKAKPFQAAEVGFKKAPQRRGISRLTLGIIAVVLLALATAAVFLAPGFVKDRAIARARDAGVDLEIGRAAVGLSGVTLHDLSARILSVPEVQKVHIDDIELVGLFGREIRVRGLDMAIDGPYAPVSDKLLSLAKDNRRFIAGTAKDPQRYVLVSGRFTWTRPFGEGTRIVAGQLGLDVASRGAGLEEVRASIARFDVQTSRSTLGPWGFAFERDAQSARARVLFDPPLMDGPSALVVWSAAGTTQLTVRIPRAPLAQLGVRPTELGLPADTATELEGSIDGEQNVSGGITTKLRLDLWSARVKGMSGPVDIHVESAAAGAAGNPLVLEGATVTVGPFVAKAEGTIEPHARGFRLDATWKTLPIACEKVARAEASKLGAIAEALQDLAHRTGAARVTGTANASGLVRYDTNAPAEVSVTWTTKDTCGLSIFGL